MNDAVQITTGRELREIDKCLSLITSGCAVNPKSAAKELPKALAVAVVRVGGDIVGVGAIKQKRPEYAKKIAKKSGFTFDSEMHELGYVAVHKDHQGRGHSRKIIAGLLSGFEGPLFATTSHPAMKKVLGENAFIHQGTEWQGQKKDKPLSLWVRNLTTTKD